MSVAQRKTGAWIVRYKENGTWHSTQFKDEAKARAFDAEKKATLQEEIQKEEENRPLTFGELTAMYFKSNERHIRTRRLVIYCINGHTGKNGKRVKGDGEFLRDKPAEELDRRDLEKLRDSLRARGVGNNAINHYQAHIRAILAWAADQSLIRSNPWRDFKRLPTKKRLTLVNLEDFRRIYAELPEWFQWAAKTAFCLCLRPGIVELFSLKWSNFDWRRGIVHLIQGKSGKIKTVIPPDEYLAEARQRYERDLADGVEYVCTRDGGRQVFAYNKDWEKACRRAGVKMRPYDIRHLAASEMLAGGADLAAVAAQLGHASVTTTGATYAHVVGQGQKKAACALPQI